jgi:hypothetical protein
MVGIRPTWAARAAAFVADVLAAVVFCTLGAPVGYWGFLGLCSLHLGHLPRLDELLPPAVSFFLNALAGGFVGAGVRACHGSIDCKGAWAIAFFIAGLVVAPVMLLALMAYVMANRPY